MSVGRLIIPNVTKGTLSSFPPGGGILDYLPFKLKRKEGGIKETYLTNIALCKALCQDLLHPFFN